MKSTNLKTFELFLLWHIYKYMVCTQIYKMYPNMLKYKVPIRKYIKWLL